MSYIMNEKVKIHNCLIKYIPKHIFIGAKPHGCEHHPELKNNIKMLVLDDPRNDMLRALPDLRHKRCDIELSCGCIRDKYNDPTGNVTITKRKYNYLKSQCLAVQSMYIYIHLPTDTIINDIINSDEQKLIPVLRRHCPYFLITNGSRLIQSIESHDSFNYFKKKSDTYFLSTINNYWSTIGSISNILNFKSNDQFLKNINTSLDNFLISNFNENLKKWNILHQDWLNLLNIRNENPQSVFDFAKNNYDIDKQWIIWKSCTLK